MFVVWYTSVAATSPSFAVRSSSPPPAPYADVKNTLLLEKIGVAMFATLFAAFG